jgi:hypothetical protein
MTVKGPGPLRFALAGAVSGAITTGLLIAIPVRWKIEVADFLVFSSLSIVAGLVFGIVIGALLRIHRLAETRTALLYAAAATVSYFVAVNLAFHLIDFVEEVWQLGMIAGLAGAGCLTALAAWLLPFARRIGPCVLMLAAGCLLGALLESPVRGDGGFWDWLLFYGAWQAAYAAAFATALPRRIEG